MKSKLLLSVIFTILFIYLIPVGYAAGDLDVNAWASPDTLNDGEQTTITIEASNFTGSRVYLTGFSIDNTFYEILGTYLENGSTQTLGNVYTASFGLNNSIGIPVYVSHDTEPDNSFLDDTISYANKQVDMYRSTQSVQQSAPLLEFLVSADNVDINMGDWVNYTITTTNTSGVDCTGFTAITNGNTIESYPMMDGTTRTINFSEQYFTDAIQEFGYYFYYDGGWYYEKLIDSTFVITIIPGSNATQQGPSSTPSPTPKPIVIITPAPSATSKPDANAKPTPTALATSTPDTNSNQNQPSVQSQATNSTPTPESSSDNNEEAADTNQGNIRSSTSIISPLVIVLVALITLLIIVGVVLVVLLFKRKKD